MNGRSIVFINQATGYLAIDIINEFASEFSEVALITGSVRVQDIPPDNRVKVAFIPKYNRGNIVKKAISWFTGTVAILFLLLTRFRRYEIVFFTIPPTAYLFAPLFRSRYSIIIYDLYPDALSVYGISPKNIFCRWWSKRNATIFRKAHKIYTLSEKMRSAALAYSPEADVHVIHNWSAFSSRERISRESNMIAERSGFNGKFVVQYSGNIGVTHHVESLVEVAEKLKEHDDIIVAIIGRGRRYHEIDRMIREKHLKNCIILPFRPDGELFESLCAADLAVVTLDNRTPNISVPSKVYNILTAGTPLMAITSQDSGIADMVRKHEAGEVFSYDDIEGMSGYVLRLKNDRALHARLSENSLIASRDYTVANAVKYLEVYKQE